MANRDGFGDDSFMDRLPAIMHALSLRDSEGRRIFHPSQLIPDYWEAGEYYTDPWPRIQRVFGKQPYADQEPDPEPEDLIANSFQMNSLIRYGMKQYNITVSSNDPDYLKVYVLQAEALFQCTGTEKFDYGKNWPPDWPKHRPFCNYEWKCYNATIVIDLVKREVSKRYQQWCRHCFKQYGRPYFTNRQFGQIVQRVIKCYERRKKAGGIVPSFEYSGSYSPKAFEPHEEAYCDRCTELEEPCWLYLVPYVKKIPLSMISFIRLSLEKISEPLRKVYAKAAILKTRGSSDVGRIRINPLSGSENIKQWRKQCETILELFLKDLTCITLPLYPELLPKIQGAIRTAQSNSCLLVKEETLLQIAGDAKEVSELSEKVKYIENITKEQKRQDEVKKRKPCIILW